MTGPIFELIEENKKANYAKFVITPLENGYGYTLGTALRRVLLTSLPGNAIVSAKIAGVKHQFSALSGMKEDIVEFLLNLKQVRFEMSSDKPVKATVSVSKAGEVKASDIKLPASVAVVDPEMVLAHLNKGTKLEAELEIVSGVGYVPASEQEEGGIGTIPLDASFSPVTRVNYTVEETRVGKVSNYDKLILEIWTDGTQDAKTSLTKASEILVTYFAQLSSPKKVVKGEEAKVVVDLGSTGKLSVEEIGVPTRVANALVKAGVESVDDLMNAKREDLIKVRNLGEKSLKIISLALAEKGVKFEYK